MFTAARKPDMIAEILYGSALLFASYAAHHPSWDLHLQTLRLLRRNAVRQVQQIEAATAAQHRKSQGAGGANRHGQGQAGSTI